MHVSTLCGDENYHHARTVIGCVESGSENRAGLIKCIYKITLSKRQSGAIGFGFFEFCK